MSSTHPSDLPASGAYALPTFDFVAPPELQPGARPRRHPLVIVGGGLAGLTLACDLASRGVPSVLLDDDDTVGVRGASSRGMAYVQRSLEIMARIGIYERVAAKGVRWAVGSVRSGHDELYRFDLQASSVSRQPPFINIQQFYVEWYLVDRIVELGLTDLRWKTRVSGVACRDDHVVLDVSTPAGNYQIEADWVVDAEGVHSALRQGLDLPQHTEHGRDRWCITDVRFDAEQPNERWTWIAAPFNEGRAVWRHPMADGVWRLDFQMAADADPAEVSRPEVARARVAAMLGPDQAFELVWVGPYAYRTLLMERLRHGRLLFIGDAAHAMSPFGGRGGNSGIMDADNLGWKLALLLRGRAGAEILDSFDAERHRAAEENIRITSRTGRFLRPRSPAEQCLRDAVLQLAPRHAFACALVNTGRLCTPHHYAGLPAFSDEPLAGKAVQNLSLVRQGMAFGLIDLLRESGAALTALLFEPATGWQAEAGRLSRALAAAAASAGLPLRVICVGVEVEDPQGRLAAETGAGPGDLALLRPDSHLAALLRRPVGVAEVLAALRRSLGQAAGEAARHSGERERTESASSAASAQVA
jgi:3-(3-hydroxy-phenyl)propionate hydroxylase